MLIGYEHGEGRAGLSMTMAAAGRKIQIQDPMSMATSTTSITAKPIDQEGILYQRRAFSAIPLLVRQAEAGKTIHYEQLARELGMPNPQNVNYVLGSIGTSLHNLGQLWGQEIPAIQALVTNKASGLPGRGFTEVLPDPGAFRRATSAQQRAILRRITDAVSSYQRWRDVLAHFEAQPWKGPPPEAATPSSGDHGGESPEHQAFKEAVRLHPAWFGIPECPASVEYHFVTGDAVDVLFTQGTRMWGVEVKSVVSQDGDILRGLFQCVKYRALLKAEQAAAGNTCVVDVYLACEHEFPAKLLGVANVLGVEFFDRLCMSARQRSTT